MLINITDLIVGIAVEGVSIGGVVVEGLIALVPQIPHHIPQLFDKLRGPPFARFAGPDVVPVLFLFEAPSKWYPTFDESVGSNGTVIVEQMPRVMRRHLQDCVGQDRGSSLFA